MNDKKIAINEADKGIWREVNPRYLKKLEKIQKQKGIEFKGTDEFDEYFSV